MVVLPAPRDVARPSLPAAFETAATAPFELNQLTRVVMSRVVASEYTPVAVYWRLVPLEMDASAGVTSIESSVAPVTVRSVEPVFPSKAAETVTVPAAIPEARPLVPTAFDTTAMDASEVVQVT